jgi:hypothetical protein
MPLDCAGSQWHCVEMEVRHSPDHEHLPIWKHHTVGKGPGEGHVTNPPHFRGVIRLADCDDVGIAGGCDIIPVWTC